MNPGESVAPVAAARASAIELTGERPLVGNTSPVEWHCANQCEKTLDGRDAAPPFRRSERLGVTPERGAARTSTPSACHCRNLFGIGVAQITLSLGQIDVHHVGGSRAARQARNGIDHVGWAAPRHSVRAGS
jgi:hypothetical protein